MANVTEALENGPHEIARGFKILDDAGNEYVRPSIPCTFAVAALQRQNHSATTYEDIGFKAEKTAKWQRDNPSLQYSITPTKWAQVGVLEC